MLLEGSASRDVVGDFEIDPDEVKTYKINWTKRLRCNPANANDTIVASAFIPTIVTVPSSSFTDKATLFLVEAAAGISGTIYPVINRVTTASGQIYDWTFYFKIKES